MKESNATPLRLLATAGVIGIALAACAAPTDAPPQEEDETIGTSESAIVSGTPTTLAQNSFVRLVASGCSGTMLNNRWFLTANHCAPHIGDSVTMDSQSRTVAEVVPHPEFNYGVDVALVRMSSPMSHAGSTSAFNRTIRTSVASPGTHVRCFGYGSSVYDLGGTTAQLRLMELGTAGGGSDVYYLRQNASGQSAAPGDAGGGCLDDTGAVLGVMRSASNPNAPRGETAMTTSSKYAAWASSTIQRVCSTNADCGGIRIKVCRAGQCVNPVFDPGLSP